jgi:hypothetical protein
VASIDKGVALVAVHGVADQAPGATAKAVVDLLVSSAPEGVRYEASASATLTLQVDPLQPRPGAQHRASATPSGADRGVWKSLRQSLLSDMLRPQEQVTDAASFKAVASDALLVQRLPPGRDAGVAVSNYLLRKYVANGAEPEAYETVRLELDWEGPAGRTGCVDVFELHWADLSRLSGQVPRILTEAATLMFRLCRLGRDTVDLAAAAPATGPRTRRHALAWWGTATLQRLLDWTFIHVMSVLMAQLALLGLAVMAFGLMRAYPGQALVAERVLVGLGSVALVLYGAYFLPGRRWYSLGIMAAGALVGSALLSWTATAWMAVAIFWLLLSLAYDRGLAVADDRFPLVRTTGRLMWLAATISIAAWTYLLRPQAWVEPEWNLLLRGLLATSEVVLMLVKITWVVMGLMLVPWLLAGAVAGREQGHLSKASVATGRMAFAVSTGGFFAVVMSLWAFFHQPLEAAAGELLYEPWLFDVGLATTGQAFLARRYEASTAAFSAVVVVLVAFALFVVIALIPSVLAELKVLVNQRIDRFRRNVPPVQARAQAGALAGTVRLGRWLTAWYGHLDRWVWWVVWFGALVGAAVSLTYLELSMPEPLRSWQRLLEHAGQSLSREWLRPLAYGATGITASLVVFGSLLSRAAPVLRAPLDVALDVDNHFREFPRTAIPRARIFSRYASLLAHLQREGYSRIVVVAHSQGSVITADLLRFLKTDADGRLRQAAVPWLSAPGVPLPPIDLLTLGSPLRQLYAARFPLLYRWCIARQGAQSGPQPGDIGVRRWLNAFCSGDYVGRWLWAHHGPEAVQEFGEPLDGGVAEAGVLGRLSTYDTFSPMPPDDRALAGLAHAEMCVGLGAHTHYFDPGERAVAALVHHLVA